MSSSDLECPITHDLFVDPVMTADGQTYERSAIEHWFGPPDYRRTSPATGLPLASLTLIPNIAIKKACDSVRSGSATATATVITATTNTASSSTAQTPSNPIRPFKNRRPRVGARKFIGRDGKTYLQMQAYLPSGPSEEGADYIFVVDESGSMESPAWVKVDKGEMGISRLDLVKHLIRTMTAMLTSNDRVALISFNDMAKLRMGLTPLTDIGRSQLDRTLNQLSANNTTNIYGAVEEAAKIASSAECKGRRIVATLLTDGVPTETIAPVTGGRKTMPMIQERIKVANPWQLHTIGFSSDINSVLLEQLAVWGNGRFLFVPSGDMVSTNGINLIAYEKTVASSGSNINYTIDGVRHSLHTGPLATGQRRDFVFQIQSSATINSVEATDADSMTDLSSAELCDCRRDLVDTLTDIVDTYVTNYNDYTDNKVLIGQLNAMLMAFYGRHSPISDPSVKAILRDVNSKVDGEGQLRLALQYMRPAEWGPHYLRAYRDHMRAGICMNFKDPGLKIFETPEFLAFQAAGDVAFASIPAPPVIRRGHVDYSISVSSAFNNSSGSCFEGSTLVQMADATSKPIRDIRPGESVYTPSGPARVVFLATFHTSNPSQPLVQFTRDTGVTPWHPCREVYSEGVYGPWLFPADMQQFSARPLKTVYNLVLDSGHIIQSGTYQFVTLGHGFQETPLKHDFFGTDACINALETRPGAAEGLPVYQDCESIKDPESGLIIGWEDRGYADGNANGSTCVLA
jgi:Hint-domain/von Willebrand factor type A domain/U-box domain/VWA / Hh  protein intein-like